MSDMNKVCISGRLTRDAVLKFLPSGTAALEFGLASNKKLGKDKEDTVFVDVTLFGASGESINQYMTKGKYVLVTGRLRLETWDTDGSKRSKLSLVADTVDFVPMGSNESSEQTKSSVDVNLDEEVIFN